MQLEPHYEVRQMGPNYQLPGAPVMCNVGIRHRNAQGEQVGPESGIDVELLDVKFKRTPNGGKLKIDEDDVLVELKALLATDSVTFIEVPIPEPEES